MTAERAPAHAPEAVDPECGGPSGSGPFLKVFADAAAALTDLHSGAVVMSGGFGLCGIPECSIAELLRRGVRDLTLISNNIGNRGKGLAQLLKSGQVRHAICSYVGGNPDLEAQFFAGELTLELVPQGTFAERIRAGGAGIRAFFTPTGVGTVVAEGKEVRDFDRPCLLETGLRADFALIKAQRGDAYGNLWFKESARNFSPLMATAATVTVAEVEELVPLGTLPAEDIHCPGIFVQRIYQGSHYENAIEYPILRSP